MKFRVSSLGALVILAASPPRSDAANIVEVPCANVSREARDIGLVNEVRVFGVPVFATARVDAAALSHAAVVLAQYLDSDDDGAADAEPVVAAMVAAGAALMMWPDEVCVCVSSLLLLLLL